MSIKRSRLWRATLVTALLAGCSSGSDEAHLLPQPAPNLTGHPTIRRFDQWLSESGYQLSAEERERYDRGQALLGVVPQDLLPVLHERAGVVEMTEDMFVHQDELSYTTDFERWGRRA